MNPASASGSGTACPPVATHSAANYALYTAVQTMEQRCVALQLRLTSAEEENAELRQQIASSAIADQLGGANRVRSSSAGDRDQLLHDLQLQVQQLSRARQLATDRLTMVATENHQLWARLSQLAKMPATAAAASGQLMELTEPEPTSPTTAHNNLIRSKTFTQNAPNPALRVKMGAVDTIGGHRKPAAKVVDDISLEEISLKVLNEFLEKKAVAEKMCTELTEGAEADGGGGRPPTTGSFGFGFLNSGADEMAEVGGAGNVGGGGDLQSELKRCAEGMADIRKEVLSQQSDIKVALSSLRQRRVFEVCPSCKHHLRLGTAATTPKSAAPGNRDDSPASHSSSPPTGAGGQPPMPVHIDLHEQRRLADGLDKMCPMCAKLYTNSTSFDAFQEHVESHFVDDTDLDSSFDRNFELVSQTVGDF